MVKIFKPTLCKGFLKLAFEFADLRSTFRIHYQKSPGNLYLGLLKCLEEIGKFFGANTLQQLRIFLRKKFEFANLRILLGYFIKRIYPNIQITLLLGLLKCLEEMGKVFRANTLRRLRISLITAEA